MADKQKQRPVSKAPATPRETRLAAALRANLARRKAQQRQRAEEPSPAEPSESED